MANELTKLALVIFALAILGSVVGVIFSPLNNYAYVISSLISILSELFFLIAIGIVLIAIGSFYLVSHIITKLTTYTKFTSISSDKIIARRTNFISIFFWNCMFGMILFITIIFMINTLFPFDNTQTPSDIDYAFVTSLIVVPGFLLSLRLLTNPVKIKPPIPLLILLVTPNETQEKIRELKERTASFFHSFIQTALYTVIILYTYLVLKASSNTNQFYLDVLTKLTPKYPLSTLVIFTIAFLIDIFFISFISEWLLEKYEVILQNEK
jgi:hypothetical protein